MCHPSIARPLRALWTFYIRVALQSSTLDFTSCTLLISTVVADRKFHEWKGRNKAQGASCRCMGDVWLYSRSTQSYVLCGVWWGIWGLQKALDNPSPILTLVSSKNHLIVHSYHWQTDKMHILERKVLWSWIYHSLNWWSPETWTLLSWLHKTPLLSTQSSRWLA